jgi:hypothetical protein
LADQTKKAKRWRFFRAGTVDQVVLADGSDLENLDALDKKLWVALACPTRGMEIDARSLDLVDSDADGRIRPPEILGAVSWARDVFKSLDDLFEPGDSLPLAWLRTDTPAGKDVHDTALRILSGASQASTESIALAEVIETSKTFAERRLNGDGVVTPASTDDDETKAVIGEVLAAAGAVADRSGKDGVDQPRVDAFFERVRAYAAWLDAEAASLTAGEKTPAAARAISTVRDKIDDYFVRCRLAAFDGRLAAALNGTEEHLASFADRVLTSEDGEVGTLPIAHVAAGRSLSLTAVNPAWSTRVAVFTEAAVIPLLGGGRSSLAEAEWTAMKDRVSAYDAWLAARPSDEPVEKLGRDRVLALAQGVGHAAVSALIAADAALAPEGGRIDAVEKAIRLRRDLVPLLRNFVNFSDFYGRRRGAFQVGTLYVDRRCCELCLAVEDVAKHAVLAGLSNAYLVYCECKRKKDVVKRTIVAAVTAGDVDNLMVGRNGVFYDDQGDDWDATITKIVDNPISIRQAFWAPYKRFVRIVQEQVSKRAVEADADANKHLGERAGALVPASGEKPGAAPPAEAKKIDVGTVAAIGVAVGGIATFLSSILATVLGLGMWMPLGLVALVLAISGPSMLIAWLKLRNRNIGPLLDANGWAVNGFARINVPFGEALTTLAALPRGSTRTLRDPFAEKRRPWGLYVVLVVIVAVAGDWLLGRADDYLPDSLKVTTVLHRAAQTPASAPH